MVRAISFGHRLQGNMKLKLFDVICLGGSLAIAIIYRSLTGDTESADRIGLAFMLAWVALQSFRYVQGKA